ncbi:MAG TPA: archaellin/type IV pilin N-terminal domain-containing protein [Thermoplasmata archaeon]|nr:archaellin/type IV pilin N-terminal domain-containing protein [Thermoplasmata archaeon]
MATLRGRTWRKRPGRGVSPIIATILLVAITVVLAAVLYVLISGLTRGPGNTPLGSAMAVSGATAGPNGAYGFNYTISIQSASAGVTANSLKFQLVNSAGTIQAFNAVTLIDVTNCAVGNFVAASGWTAGPPTTPPHPAVCGSLTLTSQISSGDQLVLITAASIAGQGYSLNIIGTGSYSGSIQSAIP